MLTISNRQTVSAHQQKLEELDSMSIFPLRLPGRTVLTSTQTIPGLLIPLMTTRRRALCSSNYSTEHRYCSLVSYSCGLSPTSAIASATSTSRGAKRPLSRQYAATRSLPLVIPPAYTHSSARYSPRTPPLVSHRCVWMDRWIGSQLRGRRIGVLEGKGGGGMGHANYLTHRCSKSSHRAPTSARARPTRRPRSCAAGRPA